MTPTSPSLTTLVDWLDQRPSSWKAWCDSSPDAARRAALLTDAAKKLEAGEWLGEPSGMSPELVAAYVDGKLSLPEAAQVEASCWSQPANLAEVISEWRFRRDHLVEAPPSRALSERLMALAPAPGHVPSGAAPFPVSPVVSTGQRTTGDAQRRHGFSPRNFSFWHIAVTTLTVIVTVATGWLAWLKFHDTRATPAPGKLAIDQDFPQRDRSRSEAVPDRAPAVAPDLDGQRVALDPSESPESLPSDMRNPGLATPETERPLEVPEFRPPGKQPQWVERRATMPGSRLPPGDRIGPRESELERFAKLPVRSELGLLLTRRAGSSTWRVPTNELSLNEPLEFASLDDAWTSADIPDVGTLVWQGASSGRLRAVEDGTLQIELERGHIAVQNLAAGARLDVRAEGARFQATGVGDYSTLAVVHEPIGAVVYVPTGIIAIGDTQVAARQAVRWSEERPSVPRSWDTVAASSALGSFDPSWLQAPDERRRREWRGQYGKLADRLRDSSDAAATLAELRLHTRDSRQAVLLARWNLAIADDPGRELWELLNDRGEAVRAVGVERLLQSTPRELREGAVYERLREATDDLVAKRVLEWTLAARRNPGLNANLARELVDQLQHPQLAVRQISVSLLERAAAPVFQQLRRKPPTYDASSSLSKRQVAQMEWRQIVLQLYTPRRK